MEFQKVQDDLELVQVNTIAARDNMGEIDHRIRVVKEGATSVIVDIPFSLLHKKIVIHLIYFVVLWLDDFLATQGISEKHYPSEIFTG